MIEIWNTFVQWFGDIIQFMYGLTNSMGVPNYGLAIILMTIAIKLVMFPLTQKQLKSMRSMQQIQPKLKYIQEKYKDDPQKMQTKVMELYKEQGVNPFSSCLPLLIQMPIFIAFYRSLYGFQFAVEEHAKFLWIPNIGAPDPYYLLAILAAVTTYFQQRVAMVDTNDPTQKTMLYVMPLFMAWIAATMPAGLPLYWVMFNILGILQQLYVNHMGKVELAKGVEMSANMPEEEEEGIPAQPAPKASGQDKGGKESNFKNANRGKKRKKR